MWVFLRAAEEHVLREERTSRLPGLVATAKRETSLLEAFNGEVQLQQV
jgi:hypothetical protein